MKQEAAGHSHGPGRGQNGARGRPARNEIGDVSRGRAVAMTFGIWGFIGSVMRSSWTSEVGVIGSNLHLESPWKSAEGSRTDGEDRSRG